MPKKLAIFFDGTRQHERSDPPSNVRRLFLDTVDDPKSQLTMYVAGVGTESNFAVNLLDALLGEGCTERVKSAYLWLCKHYTEGDQLYLFGFSRGAFIARSLAGFLGEVGLLYKENAEQCLPDAFAAYVAKTEESVQRLEFLHASSELLKARNDERRGKDRLPENVPVYFIGVWDTVVALDLNFAEDFKNDPRTQFHNLSLPANVTHARHALALHEFRKAYEPVLWTDAPLNEQSLVQLWFPGDHRDAGGGNPTNMLSRHTLEWMRQQLAEIPDPLSLNPSTEPMDMHNIAIGCRPWPNVSRSVRRAVLELNRFEFGAMAPGLIHCSAFRTSADVLPRQVDSESNHIASLINEVEEILSRWTYWLKRYLVQIEPSTNQLLADAQRRLYENGEAWAEAVQAIETDENGVNAILLVQRVWSEPRLGRTPFSVAIENELLRLLTERNLTMLARRAVKVTFKKH